MSPKSMTGYARAQGFGAGASWIWEIRTVNSRGLEIRTRLPQGLESLDPRLREALQKKLVRGNVSVSLSWTAAAQKKNYAVNEALLSSYVEAARRQCAAHFGSVLPPSIDGLMGLRGVIEELSEGDPATAALSDDLAATLIENFEAALFALVEMRAAEGGRLLEALEARLAEIDSLALAAEEEAGRATQNARDKIKSQIALLLETETGLAEERLAQEVALIASRADVREELDRLRAHLGAARDMLSSGKAVGRKLDFLCQEFNREANTLCSKSDSVALTRIGMDLKAVIEQFREQVQNIE